MIAINSSLSKSRGYRRTFFLGQKSENAVKEDFPIGQDLQDTLYAHRDRCVGMAANMISIRKKIIIVSMGMAAIVMYNPRLLKKEMLMVL